MQEHQDYYRILHLSENASLEDIKRSFRRLARDCHPDLHPNDTNAAERFRLLREAYEVLSDSARRNRYDRHRSTNLSHNQDQQEQASPQVYYVRGVEKILVRDYRGAITALSEAIRLNPRFIEAYLKRCEAYIALGQERSALEDCQRILKYKPDSAIAYYYQGRARQRLGYAESSIKAYTKAIYLDPNFAPSYYYRGVAHHELRDRNRAISDWREYAELCKQQGNLQGYRLGINALSQYSWFPFKLGNRTLEQWWQQGVKGFSQNRRPHRKSPWHHLQNQLKQGARLLEQIVPALIVTPLRLLKNPVGGILSAYGSLQPPIAIIVSLGFILFAEAGFLVGMLHRFPESEEATFRWLAVGIIPSFSLFLISWFTRCLLKPPHHWSAELFMASSVILPLAIFSFLSAFFDLIPNVMVLALTIFTLCYTILLLYGGCSQLLNLSESLSGVIVPLMIIVTTFLTWLGLSIFF
ncbi:MAG: DnaJ domain-containing protein [Halothece sp. Uz-M2-17]|nr:DnaJ domain-containing protein [Halothece sp. Uz-M2-17]